MGRIKPEEALHVSIVGEESPGLGLGFLYVWLIRKCWCVSGLNLDCLNESQRSGSESHVFSLLGIFVVVVSGIQCANNVLRHDLRMFSAGGFTSEKRRLGLANRCQQWL